MRSDASATGQFLKEFTFLLREMHWQHHFHARVQITAALATQTRHSLAREAEGAVILRFGGNGENQLTPIGHLHLYFAAKHGLYQLHFYIGIEIISLTLKSGIGLDADD